ncbi:MAG TPA: ABC transporter permease [Candidatus Baltobacteraceae bacterium]
MTVLFAYVEEAAAALWRNRVRSALTMLGMIIGSASIIAVFGISRAATSGITGTFASFGVLPVWVSVDESQDDPTAAQIQYRDVAAVREALGDSAIDVGPVWSRSYTVAAGNTHDYEQVTSWDGYNDNSLAMAEGRQIDRDDVDRAAQVCVLTADLARKYLGGGPAVGRYLRVGGNRCEVIGVYADIKGSFMSAVFSNSSVYLPATTFYRSLSPGSVDDVQVFPADQSRADEIGNETIAALQRIHGSKSQYQVQNGAGFVAAFSSVLSVIATGLSAIGGVALLVAGIGIMNIMLVSVAERTREIGIRKAIGASRGNIILQFMLEAVVLSIIGGGIGMGIGIAATIGTAFLLSKQLGELIIPYVLIVSIALSFSIAIGMIFGTYPAIRAASLDPIEALRS